MLREETYAFADELGRLHERYEALADEAASYPDDSDQRALYQSQAAALRDQARGLRWAQTAHEDDAIGVWDEAVDSVTLGGLTGGQYGRLEDDLATSDEGGAGYRRVRVVAMGTVEAPYHDPGQPEADTVAAVGELPLSFQKWVHQRVDDLSTVGDEGNWQPFGALVATKRDEQTLTE